MSSVDIRRETQESPVGDEVGALIAIVRPILMGLLLSLKKEVADQAGGYENLRLHMLGRLRVKGDGDVGICYEYAVHDAVRRADPSVVERVYDAVSKHCKVPGKELNSILFAAEKSGVIQLIDTARELITDDSRVLTGSRHQPPKLKTYMQALTEAFRKKAARDALPVSINGLWKADLFLGCTDKDRWVGTTVKVNVAQLEAASGLRVGVVPAQHGKSDKIYKDDAKNLIVCPLPYDGSFVEMFYHAWHIVLQFFHADSNMPKDEFLPTPSHRQVVKELVSRRDVPVMTVIAALEPLAQPHLLITNVDANKVDTNTAEPLTQTLIAPVSKELDQDAAKALLPPP
jgi:hypothetical protein